MQLDPLPYHRLVADALRAEEPGLWKWFASDRYEAEYVDQVRLDLLKSTYRMDAARHGDLYAAAVEVAAGLELDAPVTFYQAAEGLNMNAGLCFLPGEAHVMLTGPVLATLTETELRALIGHELAHYRLWTIDGGVHRVAHQILQSIAEDVRADAAYVRTAARLQQFSEIYADRGSLLVTGDPRAAAGCLVKTLTGLADVDPEAYIAQAREVMQKHRTQSAEGTHPESFLRVHALVQWHAAPDESADEIGKLVCGPLDLGDLDLIQQLDLRGLTERLVHDIVGQPLLNTDSVRAHAGRFFPDDAALPEPGAVEGNATPTEHYFSDSIAQYLAYVMLDFATADSDLGDVAIGLVDQTATRWGVQGPFEDTLRKELRWKKRDIDSLRARLPGLLEKAQREARTGP